MFRKMLVGDGIGIGRDLDSEINDVSGRFFSFSRGDDSGWIEIKLGIIRTF